MAGANENSSITMAGANENYPDRGLGRNEEEVKLLFEDWLVKHDKTYLNNVPSEKKKRFGIFKDNLRYIDEHNSKADEHGCRLGLTLFADLTNEEYRSRCCGGFGVDWRNRTSRQVAAGDNLPESVDGKKEEAVAPVKDQGSCDAVPGAVSATPAMWVPATPAMWR